MSDKIDKVFDLLEKIYLELQDTKTEFRGEMQGLKTDLQGEMQGLKTELRGEMQGLKTELKNDIMKMNIVLENEIKPNIKLLFEAQSQTNEHLASIDKKLEGHDRRFDVLEIKVDALAAKTQRNSYEIGAIKRKEA